MANKSSGMFQITVSFQDSGGEALTGDDWQVRVFDKDPLFDGHLGRARLDDSGEATVLIAVADVMSVDSPGERTPDLYFVLERDGKTVFRSEVFEDVQFEGLDEVTGEPDQLNQRFGPFRITQD